MEDSYRRRHWFTSQYHSTQPEHFASKRWGLTGGRQRGQGPGDAAEDSSEVGLGGAGADGAGEDDEAASVVPETTAGAPGAAEETQRPRRLAVQPAGLRLGARTNGVPLGVIRGCLASCRGGFEAVRFGGVTGGGGGRGRCRELDPHWLLLVFGHGGAKIASEAGVFAE